MKTVILIAACLLAIYQSKASDTLTVRQVFSFNVGDTFDYKQTYFNQCAGLFSISYLRKIVIQKSYNVSQDTIYYQYSLSNRNDFSSSQFFNTTQFDTISDLDSATIYLTKRLLSPGNSAGCTLAYYDTSNYWGYASDSVAIACFESADFFRYTNRLGMTYYNLAGGGDPCGSNGNIYELIHFANNSMHLGYDILDGLGDLSKSVNTYLYPNPGYNELHLSFPDVNQFSTHLIITDLLGQQVYTSTIYQSESTHDISKLTSGIYTWRVVENNNIIKTGKIVKQ